MTVSRAGVLFRWDRDSPLSLLLLPRRAVELRVVSALFNADAVEHLASPHVPSI